MTVYIEFVILDNFFITFLAAVLSYRFLSVCSSTLRSVVAAIVGTIVAVFYPFLSVSNVVFILIKLALGTALSFILFYKKCALLKGGATFLVVTFLFGGALFALGLFIYADASKALRLPITNIPAGIIIASSLVCYVLLRRLFSKFKRLKMSDKFTADIEIDIFGKTLKCRGFLDTGNALYDSKSGLPVIVLGGDIALELLDLKSLSDIAKGTGGIDKAHYIGYSALGTNTNKILVLKPDQFRLYSKEDGHRIVDVMVGVSTARLGGAASYDAILHPAVLIKRGDGLCF